MRGGEWWTRDEGKGGGGGVSGLDPMPISGETTYQVHGTAGDLVDLDGVK